MTVLFMGLYGDSGPQNLCWWANMNFGVPTTLGQMHRGQHWWTTMHLA